jgi:PKD repeat protein
VTFPGLPLPTPGGGLSLDPKTGNFWVRASIEREVEPKHEIARGALEFDPLGNEIGWTGGERWTETGTAACAVSYIGHPMLAAANEAVFMFDSNPQSPRVIEFGGPAGTGCPQASVTPPAALSNGKPVVPPVKPNTEVAFSSKVTQGNALKVEWNFGDGTTETVSKDEYQAIARAHTFTKEGTFTITETVHTDNLATPVETKSTKLTVEIPHPVAAFKSKEELNVGESFLFDGTGASDPNGPGALPLEYAWNFGDGATSTAASVSHSYGTSGVYTVALTVTDQLHLKGTVTHTIKVNAPGGGGGGGGGSSSSSSAGGGGTTTTTTTPSGGGTGVLSYVLRVASTSLTVSRAGAFPVTVDCAGSSACGGTVTLRTLTAVNTGGKHKAILTLASGSFTLAGGQVKVLRLHLSTKARQLLKRSHVLRARATIVAHDSMGVSHTTSTVVTMRAGKH